LHSEKLHARRHEENWRFENVNPRLWSPAYFHETGTEMVSVSVFARVRVGARSAMNARVLSAPSSHSAGRVVTICPAFAYLRWAAPGVGAADATVRATARFEAPIGFICTVCPVRALQAVRLGNAVLVAMEAQRPESDMAAML